MKGFLYAFSINFILSHGPEGRESKDALR